MLTHEEEMSWHRAHIPYDRSYAHDTVEYVSRSPYASILPKTTFTDLLSSARTVNLLHITTSIDSMLQEGKIFPSGGCLVGSIYCVPLYPSRKGMRAHNLGAYIYRYEARNSLYRRGADHRTITPLVIEVTVPRVMRRTCKGVDYLRMGSIHLQAFLNLRGNFAKQRYVCLEENVVRSVRAIVPFLRTCSILADSSVPSRLPDEEFFSMITRAIPYMPIIGYILFEAVSEYAMLFSVDKQSLSLATRREINCWGYKELVFRSQPELLERFDLRSFCPSLATFATVIEHLAQEGILNIDLRDFVQSIKKRFSQLVVSRLLGTFSMQTLRRLSSITSLVEASILAPSLVGHGIDRELRSISKYGDFFYDFDQYKAQGIWEYWNKTGVIFPFNGILPKGEVGVHPALAGALYKIYSADVSWQGNDLYLTKIKPLELSIVPKIIHPKHAFMGNTASSPRKQNLHQPVSNEDEPQNLGSSQMRTR